MFTPPEVASCTIAPQRAWKKGFVGAAVTVACIRQAALQELASIDMAQAEYTVTPMHYGGPAAFLAMAARTVLLRRDWTRSASGAAGQAAAVAHR